MLIIEAKVENTIKEGEDLNEKVQLGEDPVNKRPVYTSLNLYGNPLAGIDSEISAPVNLRAGDTVLLYAKGYEVYKIVRRDKVIYLHPNEDQEELDA